MNMNHALLPLILCAVPVVGAACECYPDCECEPCCRCNSEPEPAWLENMREACADGDTEAVKRLLAEGANPGKYWSLLRDSELAVQELLLPYYTDLSVEEQRGYRACFAAHHGRFEELKELLATGVAPNASLPCASVGEPVSLLYLAVAGLHTECVQLLLSCPGIDVNRRSSLICATPLHIAVSRNSPEMVRLLLSAPGIDVNAADSWGMSGCQTPLHIAAALGRTECLRLLLAAPGINPHARDRWGRTPMQLAEKAGHSACAELLNIMPQ